MEKGFTIQCNVCGETVTVNEKYEHDKSTINVFGIESGYWAIECINCGHKLDV